LSTTDTHTDTASRLRLATARLHRRLRASTPRTGLTQTQASVLFTVARCGPIGMSELAEEEDLNPTMLSRVVAGLAGQGLVERTQHPDDGRAVIVRATQAGEALRDEARRARTDVLAHELERLSPDEAQALRDALPVLEALVGRLRGMR
jgi:DNA-binding MarR family transcriptional regulator